MRRTNDDPIADENGNAVEEDGTLTVTGNVITDDHGLSNHPEANVSPNPGTNIDTDVDNAVVGLSVSPVGGSAGAPVVGTYGDLVLNADGSYAYRLSNSALVAQSMAKGEIVFDRFDYRLLDGKGGSDTATLTIEIAGGNDDPQTVADPVTVFEGSQGGSETVTANALANDTAIDQNGIASDGVLSVANIRFDGAPFGGSVNAGGAVSAAGTLVDGSYGTLSIDSNGDFIYTVDSNLETTRSLAVGAVEEETFIYLVGDGNGGWVEERIIVRVVGAEGGKIEDFFAVGGSNILEGFRFAESGISQGNIDGNEGRPLLALMPVYSGNAAAGTILTITVLGPDGGMMLGGSTTVVADLSGGWIAKFSGLELGSSHYYVQIEMTAPSWGETKTGLFKTFYAPALTGSTAESEVLTVNSVMGRRLSAVAMDGIIEAKRKPRGSNTDWRKANGINW